MTTLDVIKLLSKFKEINLRKQVFDASVELKELIMNDESLKKYNFIESAIRVTIKNRIGLTSYYSMSVNFHINRPNKKFHVRLSNVMAKEKIENFAEKIINDFFPKAIKACEEKQYIMNCSDIGFQDVNACLVAEDFHRMKAYAFLRGIVNGIKQDLEEIEDDIWQKSGEKFAKLMGMDETKFKENDFGWKLKCLCDRVYGTSISPENINKHIKNDNIESLVKKITELEKEVYQQSERVKREDEKRICQ